MELPKRPAPYIMTLLLAVLIALVYYLGMAVSSPELLEAVKRAKERQPSADKSAH